MVLNLNHFIKITLKERKNHHQQLLIMKKSTKLKESKIKENIIEKSNIFSNGKVIHYPKHLVNLKQI